MSDSMLSLLQSMRPRAPRRKGAPMPMPLRSLLAPSVTMSEPKGPQQLQIHEWPVISRYGRYGVRLVDAEKIRDASLKDESFTDYAIHEDLPDLVPDNEIWVASDVAQAERPILIHTALQEIRGLPRGLSQDAAYDRALTYQAHLRGHANAHKGSPESKRTLVADPYVGTLGRTGEPRFDVRLVNGQTVRSDPNGRADFVEGGNGAEDPMIPSREIWIEEDLPIVERLITIVHEFSEAHLMDADSLSYDRAHDLASKIEFECRMRQVAPPPELLTASWVDERLSHLR